MSEEELQNVPQMISEKMAAQQQPIGVLMNQVIDLSMMSKIPFNLHGEEKTNVVGTKSLEIRRNQNKDE